MADRKPRIGEITVDGQQVRVLDLAGQGGQHRARSGLSAKQLGIAQHGVSARALRREAARALRLEAKRAARKASGGSRG